MEIIAPAAINLSGNFPKILGTASAIEVVYADLFIADQFIIREMYYPDADDNIVIDLKDVIIGELELMLPSAGDVIYNQADACKTFTLYVGDGSGETDAYYFKVVKGGVNYEVPDVPDFLAKHFLTWQPQVKLVKQADQEWLSYYATAECKVKIKAYFSDHDPITKDLITLPADQLSSINLKYSIVDTLFPEPATDPIGYDVWVESIGGTKLSYTQRYMITKEFFEFDGVFLFENTIGGIDTIRFTGESLERKELTIKKALFDNQTKNYYTRNLTVFKKNTGIFRSVREKEWALEFFLALKMYQQKGDSLLQIYAQNVDLESIKNELSSGEFEYSVCLEEEYYSAERDLGVLPDPHIFILDPEEPPSEDNQRVFTEPFTNQFK